MPVLLVVAGLGGAYLVWKASGAARLVGAALLGGAAALLVL